MPTITSRVHSGTVSSVLRLVADWTAGIWDLSSLTFTIPTGLAGHRTTTLSSLPAFRTCYGPCYLQHGSPMLARCGNIALRDIAHMPVSPINFCEPHDKNLSELENPGGCVSLYWAVEARPSNHHLVPGTRLGSSFFFNRSSLVEKMRFPRRVQSSRLIDLLWSSIKRTSFQYCRIRRSIYVYDFPPLAGGESLEEETGVQRRQEKQGYQPKKPEMGLKSGELFS